MMNYHFSLWNSKFSLPVKEVGKWHGKGNWSVPKNAKKGDIVFFRQCGIKDPGIVAKGKLTSDARKCEHWRYSFGTETRHQKPFEYQADIIIEEVFLKRCFTIKALKALGYNLKYNVRQATTLPQRDGEEIEDLIDAFWYER